MTVTDPIGSTAKAGIVSALVNDVDLVRRRVHRYADGIVSHIHGESIIGNSVNDCHCPDATAVGIAAAVIRDVDLVGHRVYRNASWPTIDGYGRSGKGRTVDHRHCPNRGGVALAAGATRVDHVDLVGNRIHR